MQQFPKARGDYEVQDGFALIDDDDPEAYGLADVSGEEMWGGFGLYAPEDGSLGALGDGGLVQVLEGLSSFGGLGGIEADVYGAPGDARESYPLAAELDFPDDGFAPADDYGDGYGSDEYDVGADYSADAAEYDMTDVPPVNTANEAELAQILEQRRQAIADAVAQRAAQTQKVAELDQKIVGELNPQYQMALGAGDQETALRIGTQIRVLNIQRAAAVQKALDWAKFQALAAQLAKNVRAQLGLMQLFYQTRQDDPQTAAAIARAYQELGQVTMQIKAVRAQEQARAAQDKLNAEADKLNAIWNKLNAAQQQLLKIPKGVNEAKLAPSAKARLDAVRARIDQFKAEHRAQAEVVKQVKAAGLAAGVPLQGLGDGVDADDTEYVQDVQMCTLYTRDAYGPTCLQRGPIGLGDLGFNWDSFSRGVTNVLTGGSAELAWNKPAKDGVDKGVDKIGKTASTIAQFVTCPIAKNLQAQGAGKAADSAGEVLGRFATAGIVGLCNTPQGGAVVPTMVYTPPVEPPWYRRPGPVLALALVAGGVIGGAYLATRPPRSMNGLGRVARRRRRSRR